MTPTRLIELEMLANANPGTRSAPLILELVAEVRRLQKRSAKRAAFVPPSIDDLAAFFADGDVFKNGAARAIAEAFFDHYSANGWRVGRVPMTDWKAAARGWEHRERSKAPVLSRASVAPRL